MEEGRHAHALQWDTILCIVRQTFTNPLCLSICEQCKDCINKWICLNEMNSALQWRIKMAKIAEKHKLIFWWSLSIIVANSCPTVFPYTHQCHTNCAVLCACAFRVIYEPIGIVLSLCGLEFVYEVSFILFPHWDASRACSTNAANK